MRFPPPHGAWWLFLSFSPSPLFFWQITHLSDRPSPGGTDEGAQEGILTRKHEWESTTKKASNRSWDKLYCVARSGRLAFFKDQKSSKAVPEQTFRGEPPLDLKGAQIEIAVDYTKKKHVFRIKLSNGGEFLLQCHDDAEMNQWLKTLRKHT
uniref:Putative beta chain spectrin n=1 Tax=Anopheles darlingi TaxID=43151 RepID=A0A2M4DIY4_ANODA